MLPSAGRVVGAAILCAVGASCQLVAGIEPWAAAGSGGGGTSTAATTSGSETGSSSSGCDVLCSGCFGGECACGVCAPVVVKLSDNSKCLAGSPRCLAAAPDHVMVMKGAGTSEDVLLVPKAQPAEPTPSLEAVDVKDVAWFEGTGYALSGTGIYFGDATKPWTSMTQIPDAQPSFFRRLAFSSSAGLLAYVDDGPTANAGLYQVDADKPTNLLPGKLLTGATTDGQDRAWVAVSAAQPRLESYTSGFAGSDVVPLDGPAVDLAGGGGTIFVVLADGAVLARSAAPPSNLVPVLLSAAVTTKRIAWTPKFVYGSDGKSIFRWSTAPPYAVDAAFTIDAPDTLDFAADEQGLYWIDSMDQLHLLGLKNQ